LKPPRVLLLVAAFFPNATGATYSAFRLACALRDRGVQVTFVVDRASGWKDGDPYEGFPVRVLAYQETGKFRKLIAWIRLVWWIRSGEVAADFFHVQGGGHMNLLTARVVQLFGGIPALMKITLDGWDTPDGIAAYPWRGLPLKCFHALDAVVAMTSGQGEKCARAGYPGILRVIPNGVDVERYRPASTEERRELRRKIGLEPDDVVLIYVGWIGLRKGTDVLLEVFRRLAPRHPRLKLMLVGDYLEKKEEGGLLSGLDDDLKKRLILTGRVGHAEDYFRASDIFVFPSNQEGFGTVQIEAMACGLPSVVNDLPGVSCDIYPDEGTGFRIQGNEAGSYLPKIERLILDRALAQEMGRLARERVVASFSLESIAGRYLELYQDLGQR
jgi:L-malate glycosyltransferase